MDLTSVIDSIVATSEVESVIELNESTIDVPTCDLLVLNGVLDKLNPSDTERFLSRAHASAGHILTVDARNRSMVAPFGSFSCRPVHVSDGKVVTLIAGSGRTLNDLKYNPIHRVTFNERVFIAILARNKAHCLPKYLECIERLDYDKGQIVLYINTNNNSDNTVEVLKEWMDRHRKQYSRVIFESEDCAELTGDLTGPHQWNHLRCSVLANIRNRSLKMATENECDYYFVADCDNFIVNPYTLKELISERKPIVAPMLVCFPSNPYYSNYWTAVDVNFWYKGDSRYHQILNWIDRGSHKVPVVHCTYLIDCSFASSLSYWEEVTDPNVNYMEFASFCRSAIRNDIDQYVCNNNFYGYIYLPADGLTLQEEATDLAKYVEGLN